MAKERLEIEIVLDDGSIAKGFAKLEKKGKKTAKTLGKSFSDFGNKIGTQLKAAAAAYLSFRIIKTVIKDLSDLGKSIAEIKTIVSDATTINDEFVNSLIDISNQYGVSAQDQAKSYYQIISAGVTDAVAANELLIASNELAIGGLTSTAASIDILTSAVNSYGQDTLSAARASDILFGTVKLGKTTTEQLASSLGQVLPVAKAVGVSFEEVSAAIATLTLRGLSTSEAVTQLNAVFTAVLKKQELAVQMGPRVAEAFSQQALKTKGLTVFLKDLSVALGGSSEKLVKLLGRVEGAKAIIALGSDGFLKLGQSVAELGNSSGAARAAFETITNTISFQFDKLKTLLSNIGLAISLPFETLAIDGLKNLNTFALGVISAIQAVTPGLLLLADVLEGIGTISNVVFLSFRTGLELVKATLLKVAEVVLIFTNAMGVMKIITGDALETLREKITGLKDGSLGTFTALANETNEAMLSAEFFTRSFAGNADEIVAQLEKLKSGIGAFGEGTKETVVDIGFDVEAGVKKIVGSVSLLTKGLAEGKSGLGAFVAVIANTFGDALIAAGTAAIGIGDVVKSIQAALTTFVGENAIVGGLAAIALGGLLKGFASTVSGGSGATAASSDPEVESTDIETKGPQPVFNLTIQGDVLDRRESGLAIKQILEDFAFEQGGITVS